MRYHIRGFHVHSEVDNYEQGCLPDTGTMYEDDRSIHGDTQKELLDELQNLLGISNTDEIQLNACEEAGRVDIQILECEDGTRPNSIEKEKWTQGKLILRLTTYTGQLEIDFDAPPWEALL